MRASTQLLIPLLALMAACGGSGSADSAKSAAIPAAAAERPKLPQDQQIAAMVYDTAYSVPDGFYVDERADTDRSYTVHHVLDTSGSYERCTDDYSTAMSWEEADNAARSVQGYYVESYDNSRYFEFVRELAYDDDVGNVDDLTSPGFARIFKCSNTNRDGVDRTQLEGYAGMLNAQPLSPAKVREFAEYLWQFTFFPVSRKKVIDSYGQQTDEDLRQTLLLAFSRNQGSGRCDLIEVAEWQFSVDRYSGEANKRFTTVRSFEARIENGSVALCD